MEYIKSDKAVGVTLHMGGKHYGTEGFFIELTIFMDTSPDMKILQERSSGSRARWHAVFMTNLNHTINVTNKLHAGTVWEKVVKLWNSLCTNIQQEMFRKDLDPEISGWDEVIKYAQIAEQLLTMGKNDDESASNSEQTESA
ncbi:hypothetical protein GGX14DRAFT_667348 [Mycena pura]|uniref:Uncharacterized protein n=1 Tax=Mycena pura TaxID=153505 RepID=A0AAD6UYG4_9AGAR|nr:hypothetical protein GGX14DRAFT_667348 [Mycena pura]